MRKARKHILLILLTVFSREVMLAEGTRQILPYANYGGQLCLNKYRTDFAFYDCEPDYRLNIHIASANEIFQLGFGDVLNNNASLATVDFRIKDPSGTVVYGPFRVPDSGPGYIATYNQAIAGPLPAAGGYDPVTITPLMQGDYYIEFFYPPIYNDQNRRYLKYFDITVLSSNGSAIPGRVWSKAWQFWSSDAAGGSAFDRFYAKLLVLSDDSIVTQVDCNGLAGGSFIFACNSTGCLNTGNVTNDRASRSWNQILPQYKVFLNDPDSEVFPTARLRAGITEVLVDTNCLTGGFEIKIKTVKDGFADILVEVNPKVGIDAEDVKITWYLLAHPPDASGYNVIPWNGLDGILNPVINGTKVSISASYLSGMTHLPLFDIENNADGYIVSQVRPPGGQMKIFWDDSQTGGGMNVVNGCSEGGCHSWSNNFGNDKTINSWWYVTSESIAAQPVQSTRVPATPAAITGSAVYCAGSPPPEYAVPADPNSSSYTWSYTGAGVTMQPNANKVTLEFSANATSGMLSVYGHNESCRDGQPVSLFISVEQPPSVSLSPIDSVCYTIDSITLTGGDPPNGVYALDGKEDPILYPYKEYVGYHTITYTYTNPDTGCPASASGLIKVYESDNCLEPVLFPNAFTPNNDGLNDTFRPFGQQIYNFSLQIYNTYGQLIYSNSLGQSGWDGTCKGNLCPAGVYVFVAGHGLSLREGHTGSSRGKVTLLR